jgi:hypothetical protein
MSTYTTYFHIAKPDYQVLRYDQELNADMDLIEAALLGFPSSDPPGHANNYPDVTPTTGMRWVDTGNNQEKVYYNSTWQVVKTFT